MYVDNMTLVNTEKAMLVNSSIEEEIALLPGAASGTPVSGSFGNSQIAKGGSETGGSKPT